MLVMSLRPKSDIFAAFNSVEFMKVVIFAGGLGTRISEETDTRPKPMVEIGGKPILWHYKLKTPAMWPKQTQLSHAVGQGGN